MVPPVQVSPLIKVNPLHCRARCSEPLNDPYHYPDLASPTLETVGCGLKAVPGLATSATPCPVPLYPYSSISDPLILRLPKTPSRGREEGSSGGKEETR
ncbi:hypothetical protein LEMLEM_LOCUS24708 [Lemmus lemmus]